MQQFKATVKKFSDPSGWIYVEVPDELVPMNATKTNWGFIPVTATVGQSNWETSLMPLGNGQYFIALKAQIRATENIAIDSEITISFATL